ncbi:PEP-CTERM sorting domain-containing protein [Chitinivorax sp. B]|uniref:PEP-CTERM sorting domain-containing protein n=1 Tax=Chitinivorax sp. B TaxID=2502235 RepID=UPI0014856CDB|nr:PEP-CTERM sorting domain-containing protein [Chitinivorax sp. B]
MTFKPFFMALVCGYCGLANAALLKIEATGPLLVGKSVDLRLHVNRPFDQLTANETLLSFGFKLEFDRHMLRFQQFLPAASWDDDSAWLGDGHIGASRFPGWVNDGAPNLYLATLRFDVLQAGQTSLNLLGEANDLNDGLNYLYAGRHNMSTQYRLQLTTIPEPDSVLVLGVGLWGLAMVCRRPR